MSQPTSPAEPVEQTVPVDDGECVSCLAEVDRLPWAGERLTLSAGAQAYALRANSPQLVELLAELFADRLVTGQEPERVFSLWLALRGASGIRDLHRVYRSFVRTVRTRSALRAIEALWHEFDARDVRASGEQALFQVTVVVKDGRAHLLPPGVRAAIVEDLRRWERSGLRLLDREWVHVDPQAGVVQMPAVAFPGLSPGLVDRLRTLDVDDRDEGPAPSGSIPIASWTTDAGDQGPAARVSRAAMYVLDRGDHLDATLLTGLARLISEVGELGASWRDTDALRAALEDATRG